MHNHFPFTESRVPMNAANLCPPSGQSPSASPTSLAISTWTARSTTARSSRGSSKNRRKRIAGQLGATEDEIALVRNTSEANNIINNGLPLKAGDEVVLWEENHPTNNVAWDVRAARFGITVKRVSTAQNPHRESMI